MSRPINKAMGLKYCAINKQYNIGQWKKRETVNKVRTKN